MTGGTNGHQQLVVHNAALDLATSSLEELQLANIITRSKQVIALKPGTASNYLSDEDESDEDEPDGYLQHEKYYHDNGAPKYARTFIRISNPPDGGPPYERLVEEKHYDPSGVCRVDVHYALGQPYLYRKHYHATQQLKSEKVFFVEDDRNMVCRKVGHWRDYYENGSVMAEKIYNKDGVRCGFNKRYAPDGSIVWMKDYTKECQERLQEFNEKKGKLDYTVTDAAKLIGFETFPECEHKINSKYRLRCAPLHPDKQPDPEAVELFVQLSRAREILLEWFEKNRKPCDCNSTK